MSLPFSISESRLAGAAAVKADIERVELALSRLSG